MQPVARWSRFSFVASVVGCLLWVGWAVGPGGAASGEALTPAAGDAAARGGIAPAGDQAGRWNRYLELSGLDRFLAQVPVLVQMGFDQGMAAQDRSGRPNAINPNNASRFRDALGRSFAADRMRQRVLAVLQREIDAPSLTAALTELESPLHRRLSAIEVEQTAPDRMPQIQAYVEGFDRSAVAPKRLAVCEALVKETRAAELQVELGVRTNLIFGRIQLANLDAKAREAAEAQLTSVADQLRAQMLPGAAAQNLAVSCYVYREASDDDLGKYVEFYQTPLGRTISAATSKAFIESFEACMIDFSQLLQTSARPEATGS